MKYMGHKGRILEAIRSHVAPFAKDAHAICDAFCGSAAVAWDLAQHFNRPVLAGDLQSFATARAAAIITRTKPLHDLAFVERWFARSKKLMDAVIAGHRPPACPELELRENFILARRAVLRVRSYVAHTFARSLTRSTVAWPISSAYAGYYYSLEQALALDALRATLPRGPEGAVALSALIGAASKCSASPGHTAQPLGINKSALPHIVEAWNKSIFHYVRKGVDEIAPRHAKAEGQIVTASWETAFDQLSPGDVAFCDPPYSDVQYSRFYHVLETLTRGRPFRPTGTGRNPPFKERPESNFSRKSKSRVEIENLISNAAEKELRLIITFPVSRQSNGLMANMLKQAAKRYFPHVDDDEVSSVFSSLGGNGQGGTRPARNERIERIICCYH